MPNSCVGAWPGPSRSPLIRATKRFSGVWSWPPPAPAGASGAPAGPEPVLAALLRSPAVLLDQPFYANATKHLPVRERLRAGDLTRAPPARAAAPPRGQPLAGAQNQPHRAAQ